jgi:hypothetical protein
MDRKETAGNWTAEARHRVPIVHLENTTMKRNLDLGGNTILKCNEYFI